MSTSANFTSAKRPGATAAERKSPSASCIAGPWSPRRRNPLGGCGQWTSPVWSWAPPKIPGFIPFLRGYSICCKKLPIRQFFQPITKHISNQIDTHTHTHTQTRRERERGRERDIYTYILYTFSYSQINLGFHPSRPRHRRRWEPCDVEGETPAGRRGWMSFRAVSGWISDRKPGFQRIP